MSERPKSRRKVAVAGVLVAGVFVVALGGIPVFHSPPVRAAAPECSIDEERWIQIASELKDTVPARILLGGAGSSAELDTRLKAAGIDRAEFQRAATTVRDEVARGCEDAAEDAIETSFEDFPVQEGFQLQKPVRASAPESPCPCEMARKLVLELTTRLSAPASAPDHDTDDTHDRDDT